MTETYKSTGVVLRLSAHDLLHEWVLTLCMVLAIAAVLAPLLILLGLKYGTIETLRGQLIEDPVNREIKPMETMTLQDSDFESWVARPDIEFVIPTILKGASLVRVIPVGSDSYEVLDMIPTDVGDPLILGNGGAVPKDGECAITYTAAEELGVAEGDDVVVRVSRTISSNRENVEVTLKVVSVLSPKADPLSRIYVPFQFVQDVESYREGYKVAQRGWSGGKLTPFLSYDGLVVVTEAAIKPLKRRRLTINTGFADSKELTSDQFSELIGFGLPEPFKAYQLTTVGSAVQHKSIELVKEILASIDAIYLPLASADVTLPVGNEGTEMPRVVGISLSDEEADTLGLTHVEWKAYQGNPETFEIAIMLPDNLRDRYSDGGSVSLKVGGMDKEFRLRIAGYTESNYAIVPVELLGVLATAKSRPVIYDHERKEFLLGKSGYRGFRMFARSIDDVPAIYEEFVARDMQVMTQVQEIERVRVLDRGLTRIFWLVATVGIIGGIAAMMASLYASVERKKRDVSVLRLMGISRMQVFRFPVYQALTIATLSVVIAVLVYWLLSSIINYVFSADLELGQKICTLPAWYFLVTFVFTNLSAATSSLIAAFKTTQIDPAEAIREE